MVAGRVEFFRSVEGEASEPKENVGAPPFKVLLEGYIKYIVPVLPWQSTGVAGRIS
jgi:hypothetical protein